MSFSIWQSLPPFTPDAPEAVYQVGDVYVVTDDPARATQAEVDAALAVQPTAPRSKADILADIAALTAEVQGMP
jgi:hypothetical protein